MFSNNRIDKIKYLTENTEYVSDELDQLLDKYEGSVEKVMRHYYGVSVDPEQTKYNKMSTSQKLDHVIRRVLGETDPTTMKTTNIVMRPGFNVFQSWGDNKRVYTAMYEILERIHVFDSLSIIVNANMTLSEIYDRFQAGGGASAQFEQDTVDGVFEDNVGNIIEDVSEIGKDVIEVTMLMDVISLGMNLTTLKTNLLEYWTSI